MPSTGPSSLRTLLVCLVLFLGTCALFSRAVGYDFTHYDDPEYVTANPNVQGGLSWAGVRWAFTGRTDYWHPLTWLSHMLDWQLYGADARGHHMTSILWHAANAVLVFLVLRRLTGAFWTSALCAALFAWHPLRVESVVWIPERKDVMSGCFFLLTLWAYAGYAAKGGWRRYGLTLVAFAAGLMCKPVMVAVPGVLLLLDFWPLQRLGTPAPCAAAAAACPVRSWRWLALEKAPFFLLSGIIALATVAMQVQAGAFTLRISLANRLANAVVSIARYLERFFWPFNLTVCYPHPGSWPAVTVMAAGALVLALTAVAVGQWRTRPWLATGWGWFLVMLLPSIGILQTGFQSMADRYTYLPVLGLQLALLWTVRELTPLSAARWFRPAVAALVLLGCALRSWDQEATWRDSSVLFRHALAVIADNYPAHAFLSVSLLAEGRIAEAEAHARRAAEIQPAFPATQNVLALILAQQGKTDEAIAGFRKLLDLTPDSATAHDNLGKLLLMQHKEDEAEVHFQAALRLDSNQLAAYMGMAVIAEMRGLPQAAVGYYQEALKRVPLNEELQGRLAGLHKMIGDGCTRHGQFAEADAEYAKALQLQPADAETQARRGFSLFLLRQPAEAIRHWEEALRLQPDFPGLRERIEQARRALGADRAGAGK